MGNTVDPPCIARKLHVALPQIPAANVIQWGRIEDVIQSLIVEAFSVSGVVGILPFKLS